MERTCVVIKPDGVGKKVVGEIIKRLENEGLKLCAMKMMKPKQGIIETFYEVHKGKHFFSPFIDFMTSGPIIATVWECEDAVSKVRQIIGATNSKEALPETLRNLFGTDNRKNLVHSSDSTENAARELYFYFGNDEIIEYDPNYWKTR
jgi:nucleoside-diphosphate kinase